jgi:hypothetical protein
MRKILVDAVMDEKLARSILDAVSTANSPTRSDAVSPLITLVLQIACDPLVAGFSVKIDFRELMLRLGRS